MKVKTIYLVLCVLGVVLPYWQFGPWLAANGLNMPLFFQQLVSLCCRQHKRTYVAQRFMWRPPRDAHKDGSITADQRHIIVE